MDEATTCELFSFMKSFTKKAENTSQTKITEIMHSNILGGKNIRMTIFLELLRSLGNVPTKNDSFLGMCIEIMQALFLISDDMADNSETRRGRPCWYKIVGMRAIKDTFFLYSIIFKIIKKCYKSRESYFQIKHLFQRALYITSMGQTLDTLEKDFKSFDEFKKVYNLDFYQQIVYAKTSYYTVYLPLSLAYIVANETEPESLRRLSFEIGFYMQFQDDYLNFFPVQSGKSGTDLEEKKVTWYTCKLVSEAANDEDIEAVMAFLTKGNIPKIYKKIQYMLKSYNEEENIFYKNLDMACDNTTKMPFKIIMSMVHKRKK